MVNYFAVVSHRAEVAMARNTSGLKQDSRIPRWNLPSQRTAVVPVLGEGKNCRTLLRMCFGQGMLDGAVGIVVVFAQDTPVAAAEAK